MLSKKNLKYISISVNPSLHLKYWEDDGWFVGQLKEKPNVCCQGKTFAELKKNIIDCYCDLLKYESEEKNINTPDFTGIVNEKHAPI